MASGLYESKEEAVKREEVLGQIDQVDMVLISVYFSYCSIFFINNYIILPDQTMN